MSLETARTVRGQKSMLRYRQRLPSLSANRREKPLLVKIELQELSNDHGRPPGDLPPAP